MKHRLRTIVPLVALLGAASILPRAAASPPIYPPALWVMDADGGDHRRLVRHMPGHHPDLEWSPDGRYILAEGSGLLAIPVDGSRRRELTEPSEDAPLYSEWSPDGTRIAFSASGGEASGHNSDIFTVDVESGHVTRVTSHPAADIAPDWSPDSQRIAFMRRGRAGGVFVMDADGTDESRVIGGIYGEPVWSPDGSWIATTAGTEYRDIWVAAPDGAQVANITHSKADEMQISWSPDSERLAFADYYRGSIVVIDRDGTDRKTIFHRRTTAGRSPMWSADGRRILFDADDIFTIRPDGRGLRNLTPGSRSGYQPIYSPDGSTIAYLR